MKLRTLPPRPEDYTGTSPLLVVTFEEAARLLGGPTKPVSVRHVERMVKAKKLKAVGQNRARRIVYSSILAYIAKEAA